MKHIPSCFSALALAAWCLPAAAGELNVGDEAPKFTAATDEGKDWNSKDHLDKVLVVYFFPAAMTSG